MTATLPCNPVSAPALRESVQVSAGMTMFLAEELLPLMAGLWPASANQLDGNARGVAMAWGLQLRGLTAEQITDAVLELAGDTKRQFAPRPSEVKEAVLAKTAANASRPEAPNILTTSIRACEMEAEVRVYLRVGRDSNLVTDDAVKSELKQVLSERRRDGFIVIGMVS